MLPLDLHAFATDYTAAWCSHVPDCVASFFSPDGSLTINGGTPARGRQAIAGAAQSFMIAFPNLQVLMDNVLVVNDRVEYHWTLLGTNTGPGGTGKRVRISGFESWQFGNDGLLSNSIGTFDETEYRRQLEPSAEANSVP
jgi:hypothetical protein